MSAPMRRKLKLTCRAVGCESSKTRQDGMEGPGEGEDASFPPPGLSQGPLDPSEHRPSAVKIRGKSNTARTTVIRPLPADKRVNGPGQAALATKCVYHT
ncbi:hypothetical protein BaRGS_00030933 [Batillaria attramentaria]|uniref:Uncharacterized protein n=1 Tax=Batillaria attramentaria TaxID=370345 RepID=A0ABD0JT50_9CAEN